MRIHLMRANSIDATPPSPLMNYSIPTTRQRQTRTNVQLILLFVSQGSFRSKDLKERNCKKISMVVITLKEQNAILTSLDMEALNDNSGSQERKLL